MTRLGKGWWWLGLALVGIGLFVPGCGGRPDVWGGTPKKRVLASLAPVACFAANVGGDDVEVRCLLTATGPHDFQPSTQDALVVGGSDLFLVNGFGLEEFLDRLLQSAGKKGLKVVATADRIPADRVVMTPGIEHLHGNKLVKHPAGKDPHTWLGLQEAKYQVEAVRDALCDLDPAHADGFRQRAEAYKAKIDALQARFRELKTDAGLVTFHDSFRYFCTLVEKDKDNRVREGTAPVRWIGTIRGLRGENISEGELSRQADQFRKEGVRLISTEPQYPIAAARLLAEAIDKAAVKLVPLDPLETAPAVGAHGYAVDKDYYLAKMAENLDNLRRALQP
jgi:ABC-type Zn uptake system ZnuABC Zn-binding protein ZnuA